MLPWKIQTIVRLRERPKAAALPTSSSLHPFPSWQHLHSSMPPATHSPVGGGKDEGLRMRRRMEDGGWKLLLPCFCLEKKRPFFSPPSPIQKSISISLPLLCKAEQGRQPPRHMHKRSTGRFLPVKCRDEEHGHLKISSTSTTAKQPPTPHPQKISYHRPFILL